MTEKKLIGVLGPILTSFASCNKCKFYEKTFSDKCIKLNVDLRHNNISNSTDIEPDKNCPFLLENSERFHKFQLHELHTEETNKYKKIIEEIFKNSYDFELDRDPKIITISFKDSEIELKQIEKIKELLPDFNLEIDPYDSETLNINLRKKISE